MSPEELAALLARHPALRPVIDAVAALGPPDAWIAAGFVRNAVWDVLHGREPVAALPGSDIDVVFHDPSDVSPERDAAIEAVLLKRMPELPWAVANQARMHARHGDVPYRDLADALRHWPETATAVAVRTGAPGIELLAPCGLDDLLGLRLRPTEIARADPARRTAFRARIEAKRWLERWPRLALCNWARATARGSARSRQAARP